jgi:hypothetical protein
VPKKCYDSSGVEQKRFIFAKNFEQWEKEIEEHAEAKFLGELTE